MIERRMWCAVVAKLVAPMEPEQAGAALAAMLPMMERYPDGMFTEASAREVCRTGRVIGDGVFAPLGRMPTFGELDGALWRWWWQQKATAALLAPDKPLSLPGPVAGARTADAEAIVHDVVAAFVAERTFSQPGVLTDDGKPIKPRHLSPGELLATWEKAARDGWPGAAARLAFLRKAPTIEPKTAADLFPG